MRSVGERGFPSLLPGFSFLQPKIGGDPMDENRAVDEAYTAAIFEQCKALFSTPTPDLLKFSANVKQLRATRDAAVKALKDAKPKDNK